MTAELLEVRPATDVEISASILEESADRGTTQGYQSWRPGNFAGPDARGIARLRSDLESSSLFLGWIGDAAVATFSLLEQDLMYWPDSADDALYLHRFAVRRAAAGAGRTAIDWMVTEAQRRGRAYLRLDCLADNAGICGYYERAGFITVGEAVHPDGIRLRLCEMRVPG
ncbi:MAG: GNAT family N-acetyltransferase [Candidatus Dormiibacterota bacterium]